jgi:hypothetical protein
VRLCAFVCVFVCLCICLRVFLFVCVCEGLDEDRGACSVESTVATFAPLDPCAHRRSEDLYDLAAAREPLKAHMQLLIRARNIIVRRLPHFLPFSLPHCLFMCSLLFSFETEVGQLVLFRRGVHVRRSAVHAVCGLDYDELRDLLKPVRACLGERICVCVCVCLFLCVCVSVHGFM